MKIDSLSSAAAGLQRATARHAEASEAVRQATLPMDRVSLSAEATQHAAPSIEEAVTDEISAATAVEAAAVATRAEAERQQALMFVLAHHGAPIR